MNLTSKLIPLVPMAFLVGCGGDPAPATEPAAPESAAAPAEPAAAGLPRSTAPDDARLYFTGIADGDVVTSPVEIGFGLDGMDVVPAGTEAPQSGHHHVLIDTGLPPLGLPIPADARHVHFGDGSTSTSLELEPGEHTLQLLLGDHLHIPHEPPVASEQITITVE